MLFISSTSSRYTFSVQKRHKKGLTSHLPFGIRLYRIVMCERDTRHSSGVSRHCIFLCRKVLPPFPPLSSDGREHMVQQSPSFCFQQLSCAHIAIYSILRKKVYTVQEGDQFLCNISLRFIVHIVYLSLRKGVNKEIIPCYTAQEEDQLPCNISRCLLCVMCCSIIQEVK